MDTLPYAPLLVTLALALLWAALFTAVDVARLQLAGALRSGDDGQPALPAQALVLCASLGKLLVLGLACLVGQRYDGEHGFWLAGLAAAAALLVFAEFLPRRLARRNPQALASLGVSLLKAPLTLLQPFACLLDGCAKLILRPFRAQPAAVPCTRRKMTTRMKTSATKRPATACSTACRRWTRSPSTTSWCRAAKWTASTSTSRSSASSNS